MEYLLPYLCMVTVPQIMVGLERMLDYKGVGLARFHCMHILFKCLGLVGPLAGLPAVVAGAFFTRRATRSQRSCP